MIISDRVSLCEEQSPALNGSDGEDEAKGKEGNYFDIVQDRNSFFVSLSLK